MQHTRNPHVCAVAKLNQFRQTNGKVSFAMFQFVIFQSPPRADDKTLADTRNQLLPSAPTTEDGTFPSPPNRRTRTFARLLASVWATVASTGWTLLARTPLYSYAILLRVSVTGMPVVIYPDFPDRRWVDAYDAKPRAANSTAADPPKPRPTW